LAPGWLKGEATGEDVFLDREKRKEESTLDLGRPSVGKKGEKGLRCCKKHEGNQDLGKVFGGGTGSQSDVPRHDRGAKKRLAANDTKAAATQ